MEVFAALSTGQAVRITVPLHDGDSDESAGIKPFVEKLDSDGSVFFASKDHLIKKSGFPDSASLHFVCGKDEGGLIFVDKDLSVFELENSGAIKKLFQLEDPVDYVAYKNGSLLTVGKERLAKLYKFQDGSCLFTAKNPISKLDLPVPRDDCSAAFLVENSQFLVGTRSGLIRKFDIRKANKPVWEKSFSSKPIKFIHVFQDQTIIWIDAKGRAELYDIAKNRSLGVFKGLAGSVSCMFATEDHVVFGTGMNAIMIYERASRRMIASASVPGLPLRLSVTFDQDKDALFDSMQKVSN